MKRLFIIILIISLIVLTFGVSALATTDTGSFGYRTEQLYLDTQYRLQINNGYENMCFFQGDQYSSLGKPSTALGGYITEYAEDTELYYTLQQEPLMYNELFREPSYAGQNVAAGIKALYIRTIQPQPLIVLDKSFVGQKLNIPITLVYEITGNEFSIKSATHANPYLLLYTEATLTTNVSATPIYYKRSVGSFSHTNGQRMIVDMLYEFEITEPTTIYGFYLQYNASVSFGFVDSSRSNGALTVSMFIPKRTEVQTFLTLDQQKWIDEYTALRDEQITNALDSYIALTDALYSASNLALMEQAAYGSIASTMILESIFSFAPLNFLLTFSVCLALFSLILRVHVNFGSSDRKGTHTTQPTDNIKSNKTDIVPIDKE